MISRRQFLAGGTASVLALPAWLHAAGGTGTFRFGVIADTHIIDEFYRGPEGNEEDTWTIFQTTARLTAAREALNNLTPPVDMVFVVGDYFHDYPSTDLDFFFSHTTRVDHAKALVDGFRMPVHIGFGNHDYAVPRVSREVSHELFRRKLGVEPYYAVNHRGIRFIHVNNCLGATWDPASTRYDKKLGSLGEIQLAWLDAQLTDRVPTFVFVHFPLKSMVEREVADLGLPTLLRKHADTVRCVFSGHLHRWIDYGRHYGPSHLAVASTRYDQDACLIVEVDSNTGSYRCLNLDLVEWGTHFSRSLAAM